MSMIATNEHPWILWAIEAGHVPKGCNRMIIDIEVGQIVKVWYRSHPDKSLFEIKAGDLLEGAKFKPFEGSEASKIEDEDRFCAVTGMMGKMLSRLNKLEERADIADKYEADSRQME